MGGGRDYVLSLIPNVHEDLEFPEGIDEHFLVKGDYLFYHYGCDGFDDRGWGCGYRTLMSICSWVRGQMRKQQGLSTNVPAVPSNYAVQETLFQVKDKDQEILGSTQWIGSVEVSLVLDTLYKVPSKIVHVRAGEMSSHLEEIKEHFKTKGSPVMMGGDTDASSKGILGICSSPTDTYLLILDPHFWGEATDRSVIQQEGWIKWQNVSELSSASFYNLCLPQLSADGPEPDTQSLTAPDTVSLASAGPEFDAQSLASAETKSLAADGPEPESQ